MTDASPFLTVRAIASLLGISTSRAYGLIRDGEIPVTRIGGRMLVPRDSWNEFIASHRQRALTNQIERLRSLVKDDEDGDKTKHQHSDDALDPSGGAQE